MLPLLKVQVSKSVQQQAENLRSHLAANGEDYTLDQIVQALQWWADCAVEDLLESIEHHVLTGDPQYSLGREYFTSRLHQLVQPSQPDHADISAA